jgi:hypothetical protein
LIKAILAIFLLFFKTFKYREEGKNKGQARNPLDLEMPFQAGPELPVTLEMIGRRDDPENLPAPPIPETFPRDGCH